MDPREIRDFLNRDWARKEAQTRLYWAERYRREGAEATLEASSELRAHLCSLRPDWPTGQDRAVDLRHHLEFIEKLKQVADAFIDR